MRTWFTFGMGAFAAFAAPLSSFAAAATEIVTGYPDWEERQGSRTRIRNDFEVADFRAARIECRYGTQSNRYLASVVYPVPGLLLSCEIVINEPPSRPDPPIFEYFACTSRVE